MLKLVVVVAVAACAGACSSANQRVAKVELGETRALATTGTLRLVTERDRPGSLQPVVCTEPSPDYAVAISQSYSGNLSGTGAAVPPATAPTGQAAFTAEVQEQIEKGEGRKAAVLALRDGLYAACQSYANGIIGQDAYALILSQYGKLLVSLVGGGVADAAPGATTSTPSGAKSRDLFVAEARHSTLSTLMVACIVAHDRTRLRSDGARSNTLLDEDFCRHVVAGAFRRSTRG